MSNVNIATPKNTTVVICCAGMGTRLGIGTTKALVDICGVPLIIRQLQLLQDFDDIRIVVGYQAEKLINVVNEFRKDIVFAFNYQYETTGVADSLRKGLLGAREYTIILDGDTLENPSDFQLFLKTESECVVLSELSSAEPVKAEISDEKVQRLSKTEGSKQWPGMAKVMTEKLKSDSSHVYGVLNEIMPFKSIFVRTREIDTPEDYEQAIEWFENGCM
ncbi:NTP transferase domain-containing protein [Ruminococcus flavefaciens]|uniref:Choline kinase n=1 Tax=Ruminococcus flavefaciens TaxID=1265 RepID=A0A1M7GB84_RUMFL|nr:NTP transferase domain-containing protein [Ruminococcus flavefaciens]SHM13149.1 Choline kinase [Ruminococcus flavefaciens]